MKPYVLICLLLAACSAHAQSIAASDYRSYFPRSECNRQAFALAVQGYNILRSQKLLANPRFLSIVDFTKRSNRKRFFVLDLKRRRLAVASITAHGVGSDPDSCTTPYCFSNRNGSKASSVGFYITGGTYTNHRPSDSLGLCLFGLDKGYNDSAAAREIVIHYGATEHKGTVYVTDSGAARSYGCPALPLSSNTKVIQLIKGGSCLFIYSAKAKGFASSSTVLTKSLREPIVQQGPPPNNCSCRLQPANQHQ
jgi:hypothetical protein